MKLKQSLHYLALLAALSVKTNGIGISITVSISAVSITFLPNTYETIRETGV